VDPLCCFKEVYTTIFSFSQQHDQDQLVENMKKYPIFKHLIQFSNLVDTEGNFISGAEIETKVPHMLKEEHKRSDDPNEEQDPKGGDKESEAYEGGESNQEEGPKQPNGVNGGTGVSSQINNLPQQ